MIRSLREEQRRDLDLYAAGLTDWLRGVESDDADAAARNVAELLSIWRKSMTEG